MVAVPYPERDPMADGRAAAMELVRQDAVVRAFLNERPDVRI